MVIYSYTLPALFAFLSKIVILVLSLRSERDNFQTRLFLAALFGSIVINIAEIGGLQKLINAEYAFMLHYAAHIPTLAILAHLAVSICFVHIPRNLFIGIGIAIYGYGFVLEVLLIFTRALVSGFEPIGNYTYTRIPGAFFWMYELFMLACLAAITVLPAWGLRKINDVPSRNRCKLWITLAAPLVILILVILVLLHLGYRWFNATVTTPLLIAAFLAAVGYAVHHHRLVDLSFYFPWSRLKKLKTRLYARLVDLSRTISHFHTVDQLLEHLTEVLGCPVALVGPQAHLHNTRAGSPLTLFPQPVLRDIDRMVVASEIRESEPQLYAQMAQCGVAAIVPFFPYSHTARHWLLLGDPFNRAIYMPQDFKHVERLFKKIAGLLLDNLMEDRRRGNRTEGGHPPETTVALKKSLPQSVAEFESALIRQALTDCRGNQRCAAQLLGVRPNTLHYKIERYGLSVPLHG